MPWVRGVIRDIFGTLDDDGTRVYRDVYLEMPNGSSKTTICAGFVVALLGTAQGTGTEVYSAATTKEQASIVFRAAAQMIGANARLSSRMLVTPSTKTIVRRDDPTSFYKAISADGFAHDGLAPSFVVRDELHRWRTFRALELNEVLERKIMKRKNPLIIDITSAGDPDESPLCYRRHEYAIQIKEKVFQDPRFYGRICAVPEMRQRPRGPLPQGGERSAHPFGLPALPTRILGPAGGFGYRYRQMATVRRRRRPSNLAHIR